MALLGTRAADHRGCLGDHLYEILVKNKLIEWSDYRRHVTDYEIKRYLPVL